MPANVISGFAPSDTIGLDVNFDPAGRVQWLPNNSLEIIENGATYVLNFDPTQNFTGEFFHLSLHLGPGGGSGGTFTTDLSLVSETRSDFLGGANSDILWQDANTGLAGYWNMNQGQNTGFVNLGGLSGAWSIVDTANFEGGRTSDVLWRNSANGDVALWNIANGQVAGSIDLGTMGPNWSVQSTHGHSDFGGTGLRRCALARRQHRRRGLLEHRA